MTLAIDFDAVEAIDIHTHAEISKNGHTALSKELVDASAKYFKTDHPRTPSVDEVAAYYRERKMAAVIFTVDAESATGQAPVTNDEVAQSAAENNDVLIPFASVDPWKGKAAVQEVRRTAKEYGIRGLKLHPNLQAFFPNDRMAYPLYEACQELRIPVLFHSGTTGIGAALPGGGGIRLKYSDPMYVDDVAADFPDLDIILAHPSFPWQDNALAVANHKQRVYIDLSGWSPKYFPPQLVQYAKTMLKHKVLFGSDYPVLTPDRWLADFDKLGFDPETRQLILKDNALRLLRLKES